MKKQKIHLLLFIIGILFFSFVPILNRVVPLPDLGRGFLVGIGLGLMGLGLFLKKGAGVA